MTKADKALEAYLEKNAGIRDVFTTIKGFAQKAGTKASTAFKANAAGRGMYARFTDRLVSKKIGNTSIFGEKIFDGMANPEGVGAARQAMRDLDFGASWGTKLKNMVTGGSSTERKVYSRFQQAKKDGATMVRGFADDLVNNPTQAAQNFFRGGSGNVKAETALSQLEANSASFFGKNKKVAKGLMDGATKDSTRQRLQGIIDRDNAQAVKGVTYAGIGTTGVVGYNLHSASNARKAKNEQLKEYYMSQSQNYRK